MTVSQAVGLCPSLLIWEPDPVYYDEKFTAFLKVLESISPVIEPAELGRVFIGADGLEGLYGPAERQLHVVSTTMGRNEQLARFVRLGWGHGKFAASVAASKAKPGEWIVVTEQGRKDFLEAQPIGVLPIEADTHRKLWQLGLRHLRDVAGLPEVAVVSQFGSEGRRLWELATGAATDRVVGQIPPEPITAATDFPNPVADIGLFEHALKRLVAQTLRHPRRTGWRVAAVRVRAWLERGASWMITTTLKDPTADLANIMLSLTIRLNHTPMSGAVESVVVELTKFVRGTDELQLFARDANSAARTGRRRALQNAVREIKMRFRHSGLYHVVELQPGSHIPERRYALVDFDP